MTQRARFSPVQTVMRFVGVVRSLPQLLLVRYVRWVALIILLIVLLLGAQSVIALLYLQPAPAPQTDEPAATLSLDKLPIIEQQLQRLQQNSQAGLVLEKRIYFEASSENR